MLVRGQPERALMHLGDLPERRLEHLLRNVLDTAVLDEGGEVVLAVLARDPAELVRVAVKDVGSCGLEGIAEEFLNFGFKIVESHAIDGILQTSVLATGEEFRGYRSAIYEIYRECGVGERTPCGYRDPSGQA